MYGSWLKTYDGNLVNIANYEEIRLVADHCGTQLVAYKYASKDLVSTILWLGSPEECKELLAAIEEELLFVGLNLQVQSDDIKKRKEAS